MEATTTIIDPPQQTNHLLVIAEKNGLPSERATKLLEPLLPMVAEAGQLCAQSASIRVTDATQVTEMRRAREMRLKIRALRTTAEAKGKQIKQDALCTGRTIDAARNWFKDTLEAEEERLLACEEFAIRAEAERKGKLKASREAILQPLGVDTRFFNLAEMTEEAFSQLVTAQQIAIKAREDAAKAVEEEKRKAQAHREAEELLIRQENDHLRKQKEAAEAQAAQERKDAEAKLEQERAAARKAQEVTEAKAKAEKEEADRIRMQEQLAMQRKLDAERAEKEKLEAANRKREEDEARKRAADARAKRRMERAPDVEKIKAYADGIKALPLPAMKDQRAIDLVKRIEHRRNELIDYIEQMAAGLANSEAA